MPANFDKIICIDDWKPDDSGYERGYYPEGTREKAVYFSPVDVGNLPLRPNWRYLFKKSRTRAPWQFWMEIIAHRIGELMDVPVPPAYVGLSNRENPDQPIYGALIEWFYSQEERYVDGARLIGPLMPGFDYKTGKPQNLMTILNYPLFNVESNSECNRQYLLEYWAKVLTFDSVIGNVDRHPENWGVVFQEQASEDTMKVRMSPAFDNGTALSYEQPEEHFARFDDEEYANRYLTKVQRARHHMQWSLADERSVSFFDFMGRFVRQFPQTKDAVISRLQFTDTNLRARMESLPSILVPERCALTQRRLDFTLKMIMKRVALLKGALEQA